MDTYLKYIFIGPTAKRKTQLLVEKSKKSKTFEVGYFKIKRVVYWHLGSITLDVIYRMRRVFLELLFVLSERAKKNCY
jgi:hypothetical protein